MRHYNIILGSLVALLALLAACASPSGQGRVVFALTDAAANIQDVHSVKVTIENISVHTDASGWVMVRSTPIMYDLIELRDKDEKVILADVKLQEGTYQQVRLSISKVIVDDAITGVAEAKLPSGDLKIVGNLVVAANETAAVTFDFLVNESLHLTGKRGEYIMAPVVRLETRSDADINIEGGKVDIVGGHVTTDTKVGMDAHGKVGVGLNIAADQELSIENGQVKA